MSTVPDVVSSAIAGTRPLKNFDNLTPADHLFDDLGFDSLDRVTVAIELEEELDIDLPDHVVARWFTVADIIRSVPLRAVA